MEGMYPPAKRHEGEAFGVQQYGSQQPDMFPVYGGGGGGYMGPERRPIQGQYPYPYSRDRQGPPQHSMMSSGPAAVSGGSGEVPQANMWHPRTDMGYTYSRQGQGPAYRGDDQESRAPQDDQWAPGHPSQRQTPYPPHSSAASATSIPPLPSRQPPASFQATPTIPNHVTRSHSPSTFPRPMGSSLSPNSAPYLPSMKKPPVLGALQGPLTSQTVSLINREVSFPHGSVEATPPKLKPRRRLTAKDTGAAHTQRHTHQRELFLLQVFIQPAGSRGQLTLTLCCYWSGTPEAWRVMMSLKSGLLAESTWALDTINILLYDDSTVGSFSLPQVRASSSSLLIVRVSDVCQSDLSPLPPAAAGLPGAHCGVLPPLPDPDLRHPQGI